MRLKNCHNIPSSVPYEEAPQLMEGLAKEQNIPSLCLRLLILTGVRSGEVRGAVWDEVDLASHTWTSIEHSPN